MKISEHERKGILLADLIAQTAQSQLGNDQNNFQQAHSALCYLAEHQDSGLVKRIRMEKSNE